MRIATMVRGYIPAPIANDIVYAPIDLATIISEGLTRLGHAVTFYGPIGTNVKATKIESLNLRPLAHNQQEFQALVENTELFTNGVPGQWDSLMALDMFERANKGEFDLLHFHHVEIATALANLFPNVPVVYTMHDPIKPTTREIVERLLTPSQSFITISNNQRRTAPDLPYAATVYNGIDMDLFALSEEHEDYLLFVGRMVPEKGVEDAIKVAQQTNSRLLLIGPTYNKEREFFETCVKPHLNEKILYLGFMEHEATVRYFQKAKALLMPIRWEEPFGLSMVESMACGTPVIAMRRGSVPEVVADGISGYIVDSIAEMTAAVSKVGKLKPKNCRKHVQDNFSADHMVRAYEATFKRLIAKGCPTTALQQAAKTAPALVKRGEKKAPAFIKQR